jgi:hypothetical protein
MQKIYCFRKSIPSFECVPGCHDCCGLVTASSDKMFELPIVSVAARYAALASLTCPHLGEDGFTAYADRPLICRRLGTTLRIACTRSGSPVGMADPLVDKQIPQFLGVMRQVPV